MDDRAKNRIFAVLEDAVTTLGVSLGKRSHARKDGFRPNARRHVERYLLSALGVRPGDMAWAEGYSRSNIYESIRVGRLLARENAALLGLRPWAVPGT